MSTDIIIIITYKIDFLKCKEKFSNIISWHKDCKSKFVVIDIKIKI